MATPDLRLAAGLLATAIVVASTSASAADDDLRLWPMVAVSAPIGARFQVRADALVETTGDGSTTGLNLVRIVVLRQAGDRAAFGGGYTLVRGETGAGNAYVEHRALQELDLRLVGGANGLLLTSRTRLEERGRESQPGLALRLRHQTRLELPLPQSATRLVTWNEYFHSLGGTAWSSPSGPSFMLTFVGLRIPATDKVSIEPGYLNQITFGAGHDRIRHIGALTVALRF